MKDSTGLDHEAFANELRHWRKVRGISQYRLALDAELDHSYISRLEMSNRLPSRDAVARLADVLKIAGADRVRFAMSAGFWMPGDCAACGGTGEIALLPVPCEECAGGAAPSAADTLAAIGRASATVANLTRRMAMA